MDLLTALKVQDKMVGSVVMLSIPSYSDEPLRATILRTAYDEEDGWWQAYIHEDAAVITVYYQEVIEWDNNLEKEGRDGNRCYTRRCRIRGNRI
jgi:hypothetical protein